MKRIGVLLLFLLHAAAAPGAYLETWDDEARTNHNWRFWAWGSGWTGGVNMVYNRFGGIGNLNYVRTWPLESAEPWLGVYWPAYTEDTNPTNRLRDPAQDLQLDKDSIIRVYCRTLSPTDTLFNGAVYFFVGEWMTNGNMAFYRHSTPVTVNTNDWDVRSTIDLRQGSWVTISNVNGRPVEQVYTNPQQYGFVIVGATSCPAGQLGFDNFSSLAGSLVLSNLTVTNWMLQAATNTITATNWVTVAPAGDLELRAGAAIRLAPGFHARSGSVFRAVTDPGL